MMGEWLAFKSPSLSRSFTNLKQIYLGCFSMQFSYSFCPKKLLASFSETSFFSRSFTAHCLRLLSYLGFELEQEVSNVSLC